MQIIFKLCKHINAYYALSKSSIVFSFWSFLSLRSVLLFIIQSNFVLEFWCFTFYIAKISESCCLSTIKMMKVKAKSNFLSNFPEQAEIQYQSRNAKSD